MRFHYDSPEAARRASACATLALHAGDQLVLLQKMRRADGRTTEFRTMSEQSDKLETLIQNCIAIIINPEVKK
jgi:hypothetical protein